MRKIICVNSDTFVSMQTFNQVPGLRDKDGHATLEDIRAIAKRPTGALLIGAKGWKFIKNEYDYGERQAKGLWRDLPSPLLVPDEPRSKVATETEVRRYIDAYKQRVRQDKIDRLTKAKTLNGTVS